MNKLKRILFFTIILNMLLLGSNLFADGLIIIKPPVIHEPYHTTPFPLEVKYHHVDVKIKDQASTTFIDQIFYNPTSRRLEGFYLFPVPEGAVIKKFSMYINGKEIEAELLDAKKARKIYEDIVREQLDPALLEYDGLSLFKARIFPIEPNSEKRVKISYNEILNKDSGVFEYLYPLNTEKFSSKPLQNVRINIDIQSSDNIKNAYCTSHETEIIHKNEKHVSATYEAQNIKPDMDFKLYYNTQNSKIGLSLTSYREKNENGFFFMNISPGFDINKGAIDTKDITFVLDTSGSMAGKKLDQAKKALLFCIENLNEHDRFQIIRFSTEAEMLFNKLAIADKKSLQKAKLFINNLKAIGGTHIEEALELALDRKSEKSSPHIIIFITDGKPTIGETNEDNLIKKVKDANSFNTRIFTFGIGHEINTHLLDKITELTKAYRTYISPDEDIEVKISNFYIKVQSPILTDIRLKFGKNINIFKTYPKNLPDLFKGSSLNLLGQYKGSGNTKVILEGKIKNKKQILEFNVNFPEFNTKDEFIPVLWAARRIGYLLDQIRLHGEDSELIDEITDLARRYGIVTPYTSYLIIEDEATRTARNQLDVRHQTLNNMTSKESDLIMESKKDYFGMNKKSGEKSIRASKEFQALNEALNFDQTRQGKSRLSYKDKKGKMQNLAQQVKNIQGRAIYQTEKFWIDSKIQTQKKWKTIRIKFASIKYFELLQKERQSAQFLALGRNVRFVLNDLIYEVYE